MQETWIQSLGWEDPLEEEMANYSSVFAWQIPWTEEPGGLQPTGYQRVGHDWWLSMDACTRQVGSMISRAPVLPHWYGLFLHRGCTDIICCVFLFLAIVGYVAVGIIGKRRRGWGGGSWVCGQPTASGAEGQKGSWWWSPITSTFLDPSTAWTHGDPRKVIYPTDSRGQFCGQKGTKNEWVWLLGAYWVWRELPQYWGEGSRLPSPPSIH